MDDFSIGYSHYEEGNFVEAASHLHRALVAGNLEAASSYADICWRNLDKKDHSMEEAAQWYICAAYDYGDGDILSFLRSCSIEFAEDTLSREEKVAKLALILKKKEEK